MIIKKLKEFCTKYKVQLLIISAFIVGFILGTIYDLRCSILVALILTPMIVFFIVSIIMIIVLGLYIIDDCRKGK